MNPALKYTLARLGLFVVVLAALLPVPVLSTLVKLMIAVLVSAVASWFLLRRMRDQVADRIEVSMERRREEREKLRAALAGDEPADAPALKHGDGPASKHGDAPEATAKAEEKAGEKAGA